MILILKVFFWIALISKGLKLQMPDWSQIKVYQIFLNLRPIWHLWLKPFRNETNLKRNCLVNQQYVDSAINSWILSCIRCSVGKTWHTELNLQILQPWHDGTLCRGETSAGRYAMLFLLLSFLILTTIWHLCRVGDRHHLLVYHFHIFSCGHATL